MSEPMVTLLDPEIESTELIVPLWVDPYHIRVWLEPPQGVKLDSDLVFKLMSDLRSVLGSHLRQVDETRDFVDVAMQTAHLAKAQREDGIKAVEVLFAPDRDRNHASGVLVTWC